MSTRFFNLCNFSDKSVKNQFERDVRSGGQTINDCCFHMSYIGLPFGGFGKSGIGAYNGYHGFQAFSHFKPKLSNI